MSLLSDVHLHFEFTQLGFIGVCEDRSWYEEPPCEMGTLTEFPGNLLFTKLSIGRYFLLFFPSIISAFCSNSTK